MAQLLQIVAGMVGMRVVARPEELVLADESSGLTDLDRKGAVVRW
jgi:hypothetical protein